MLNSRGARTNPCGTPFLRRRNLLLWPFPVVRVKNGKKSNKDYLQVRTSKYYSPIHFAKFLLLLQVILEKLENSGSFSVCFY